MEKPRSVYQSYEVNENIRCIENCFTGKAPTHISFLGGFIIAAASLTALSVTRSASLKSAVIKDFKSSLSLDISSDVSEELYRGEYTFMNTSSVQVKA